MAHRREQLSGDPSASIYAVAIEHSQLKSKHHALFQGLEQEESHGSTSDLL